MVGCIGFGALETYERCSWCTDHSTSAVRKLRRVSRPRTVLLVARTTVRSMLLAQLADFIVSSCLDAWRCSPLHACALRD